MAFFDNDDIMEDRKEFQPVEGPCLVIFHDDRVAHSYVPRYDYRIPCGSTTPHISKQSALPYLTSCLDSPQHAMHMLLGMRPQITWFKGLSAPKETSAQCACPTTILSIPSPAEQQVPGSLVCKALRMGRKFGRCFDRRIDGFCRYAMETHGVMADRIAAPITQDMIQPVKPAGTFTRNVLNVVPFLALGLAYAATQYAAHIKVRAASVQFVTTSLQ